MDVKGVVSGSHWFNVWWNYIMGGLFYRVKLVKVLLLRFICRRMNPYIRKKSCLEEVGMKENNVYIPPMQMTFISVMTKSSGKRIVRMK